jgi:hypothetical protein
LYTQAIKSHKVKKNKVGLINYEPCHEDVCRNGGITPSILTPALDAGDDTHLPLYPHPGESAPRKKKEFVSVMN